MQTITHPNGIVLTIDETLTANQTQAGYMIEQKDKGSELRCPFVIEIRLEDGPEPDGQSKLSIVDWTRINYRIVRESGGGSHGDEYTMTAWRPCLGKQILAIQRMQAEMEWELDFQKAFQIIAHASCNN